MEDSAGLAIELHPAEKQPLPCGVNRRMLPIKGFYFVFMAGVGVLLPYIALYMRHLGLSYHEMGIIYGIMPFVGFFIRPVIGAVADKLKIHKVMLISCTVLTAIFFFLLIFVPQRPPPPTMTFHTKVMCNTQDSFIQDCQDHTSSHPCRQGLSYFVNSSQLAANKTAEACSFHCVLEGSSEPTFQACFTDEVGPYSQSHCNGTMMRRRHLDFEIQDLKHLLSSEIVRDRVETDTSSCKDYDLKNVLYFKDSQNNALQILCQREMYLQCEVNCSTVSGVQCALDSEGSQTDATFFIFLVLFLFANIAFSPVFPILDGCTYDNLGKDGHLWGRQRLFGTIGFALFACTSGFIMYAKTSTGQEIDFKLLFYLNLALMCVASGIAVFMRMSTDIVSGEFLKDIWNILASSQVLAFLTMILWFGVLTGAMEAFMFVYLSTLGASPLLFGFMLLTSCTAEAPMFFVSGHIINKIGYVPCLYLALLCYAVRMFVYSVVQDPWMVLLVEPVHCVTFALMYAAASSYASVISPPGMSATLQGLIGGMHFGFGKGIGAIATGVLVEQLGYRWTWLVYSIVCLVLFVLYLLLNLCVFRNSQSPGMQGAKGEEQDEPDRPQETLINENHQQNGAGGDHEPIKV